MADWFDRRYVLLFSQYVQMADATILTVLVFTHIKVQVWEVLMPSFVSGLAQAFGGPAYQALRFPTLVNKEDMPNAIALNSIRDSTWRASSGRRSAVPRWRIWGMPGASD